MVAKKVIIIIFLKVMEMSGGELHKNMNVLRATELHSYKWSMYILSQTKKEKFEIDSARNCHLQAWYSTIHVFNSDLLRKSCVPSPILDQGFSGSAPLPLGSDHSLWCHPAHCRGAACPASTGQMPVALPPPVVTS